MKINLELQKSVLPCMFTVFPYSQHTIENNCNKYINPNACNKTLKEGLKIYQALSTLCLQNFKWIMLETNSWMAIIP